VNFSLQIGREDLKLWFKFYPALVFPSCCNDSFEMLTKVQNDKVIFSVMIDFLKTQRIRFQQIATKMVMP